MVRIDGHILVKRLQYLPGGKPLISSDNDAFKPYEITPGEGIDLAILGRVILVLKRM